MSSSRSNYRTQRKDLRDTFDPHLAVDPEDRPYLTMDMTEEGDDFPRELRRNARNRPPTTRYYERDIGEALDPHLAVDPEDRPYLMDEYEDDGRETIRSGRGMSKARRDIGEALDPHLAVDPEDRPYLLDKYEDDSRRGKGSRSKAEKKTNESYRARRDYNNEKRRDTSSLPSSKTDLVCIDGSAGADRAMLYAARNLPKDHTLLLVHGVHSWMGSSISETDKPDILELEDHYESLCKKAGRDCKFKHFSYTTTSGFGDEVCSIADKKGAASVVIGRRENVSGMRRTLMGSSSQSVMNNCYVPVTIVGTAINNTKTKQY
jgi:nucleotide-binding universal stress UspA family protein